MQRPNETELRSLATLIRPRDDEAPQKFENIDQNSLLTTLDYHGITLLAADKGTLPSELATTISQRKAMLAANDLLKQAALIELFEAFNAANLNDAVLFKGSALAYTTYSKPWLRPRSDSDILIKATQKTQYHQALTTLGYEKHFAIEGNYVSYQNSYSKALPGKSVINIDLHWRINNRQALANSFSNAELYDTGQDLSALSDHIRIPCEVNSLLISCLHRLGHHQREERLAWLYDIHLLATDFSQEQWTQLLEKAAQKKLASITLDGLEHSSRLLDTAIPDSVLVELEKLAKSKEPSKLFLQRDLAEWRYFINDLKCMPNLHSKLGFIRETLFPPAAYVRQQMQTKSTIAAYLKRAYRGLSRALK